MNTHLKIALLIIFVFISLNSCETCLYDSCPDDPIVTEITDLELTPSKDPYARTDTIRIKVVHARQGDKHIEFRWILKKQIELIGDIAPSDCTRQHYFYNTRLEEISILPKFEEPTRTSIEVIAIKIGHSNANYVKTINVE